MTAAAAGVAAPAPPASRGRRWSVVLGAGLSVALVVGAGVAWWSSLVPDTYSVMDMGVVELGGGPGGADHASAHGGLDGGAAVSTADLTGPRDRAPDVAVTLTADAGGFRLASGEELDGLTLDGASPGPELRATQGDLVEVVLRNVGVRDGVTLHWHGVDLPNAEDGVAGVTQDAVPIGGEHVYRFVAQDAGTYWYHSHQVSHEQVREGLFGVLVVEPRAADDRVDVVAPVHSYGGLRTLAGRSGVTSVDAEPGTAHRVRLLNTDSSPLRAWITGTPFRVLAVDGTDLRGPTPVEDRLLVVAAGGRLDLEVVTPADGSAVRLDVGGGTALVLGPAGARADEQAAPDDPLDLLSYGAPAPPPFDVDAADRSFEYRIGRRPGLVDGRPGFWWTVDGGLFPDVPMYVVDEGDVVRVRITNDSGDVHPMHLHGHHALVLSRDGVPATGSPWWVDSLNVQDGESYEIAFLADNPGVWMFHCHDLQHAAEGLVAHVAYRGTTTPFRVGTPVGGNAVNAPE